MNNLSTTQSLFGRIADSATTYEELVDSMERFGRDTDRRWGRAALAWIRINQGRWDEALELLDPYIAEVEGGSPHYLEPEARVNRASIRVARGDLAGASADTERALEAARLAEDLQLLAPALEARADILLEQGMRVQATALVDEALAFGDKLVPALGGSSRIIEFAWLARALGRQRPLLALLETAPEIPWVAAGRALASGEPELAADVLAQVECPPAAAYMHLRAAQELVDCGLGAHVERHVEAALTFYREVGATRFIAEGEGLRLRAASQTGTFASDGEASTA